MEARSLTSHLREVHHRCGAFYTAVYAVNKLLLKASEALDGRLVAVEQKRRVVEPWTASARRYTSHENRELWNGYDWSARGEEWTFGEQWKDSILKQFLDPYIAREGTIVEIGPGGGRWTEHLQRRATHLYLCDVSERPLQLCRERFADCTNVSYLLGDGRSIALPDASVNSIWSYDVFVHINPVDCRNYFVEFARILVPGARAVIHHPGDPKKAGKRRVGWRSDLTSSMVDEFAASAGLKTIMTSGELVNPGDRLIVLEA